CAISTMRSCFVDVVTQLVRTGLLRFHNAAHKGRQKRSFWLSQQPQAAIAAHCYDLCDYSIASSAPDGRTKGILNLIFVIAVCSRPESFFFPRLTPPRNTPIPSVDPERSTDVKPTSNST